MNVLYFVFELLSILILISAFLYLAIRSKHIQRDKRIFSSLHIITFGVFLSVLCLFLPIYYQNYEFGDNTKYLRPLLLSIHNTFRVFILDGEFDIIRNCMSMLQADEMMTQTQGILFSVHAAILYVAAPILTFGNVLLLFRNLRNDLKFFFIYRRPLYIFSELNERSIKLAESIFHDETIKRPVIVFTEVFIHNEEEDYELLLKAEEFKSILLKKDIGRLNIHKKLSHVEFFLIGENESENVEHAIKLTQKYKNDIEIRNSWLKFNQKRENKNLNRRSISILVYSNRSSTAYILDSIDKGEYTLDPQIKKEIQNPKQFLSHIGTYSGSIDSGFYIRRIDSGEELVQNTLSDPELIKKLYHNNPDKVVSVMLVGLGSYGKQFLKQALWLYQLYGFQLEINIFDSQSEKIDTVKKLSHDWPEIICNGEDTHFVSKENMGDEKYDIKFFLNTDCFSSDFDSLFDKDSEYFERLKRTQLVVVSLGDDEKNIDAAVMLRSTFKRLTIGDVKMTDDEKSKSPLIYSIVYDDKKSLNVKVNRGECEDKSSENVESKGLVNYRNTPLYIHFIGSLTEQYSYSQIKTMKQLETEAMEYHLEWIREDMLNKSDEQLKDDLEKNAMSYMNYEYFRKSSISRAIHHRMLISVGKDLILSSAGEVTEERKKALVKTEHMRWNVYMRTNGYRHSESRDDTAKTHHNLIPWESLSPSEKRKDLDKEIFF